MTILVCSNCNCKVKSPKCHGVEMELKGTNMVCSGCGNSVEVNHCCAIPMNEKK